MLTLKIRVPADRSRAGIAELASGSAIVSRGPAVAAADAAEAKRQGNANCDPLRPGGHPPSGRYRLVRAAPTPGPAIAEYGPTLLVFEAETGPALQAESYGRFGLLAYGGSPGGDGALRRTQGGLRLSDALIHAIDRQGASGQALRLELVETTPRAWWQFWKKADPDSPVSSTPLRPPDPPLDEPGLLGTLLDGYRRAVPASASDTDDDRDRYRSSSDDTRRSEPAEPVPEGRGGTSGGAGASAGWGSGPAVDASGRIVAAGAAVAAGVAAGALLATAAAEARSAESSGESGPIDTSTSTSY